MTGTDFIRAVQGQRQAMLRNIGVRPQTIVFESRESMAELLGDQLPSDWQTVETLLGMKVEFDHSLDVYVMLKP